MICSIESTAPGRAVALGAVALGADELGADELGTAAPAEGVLSEGLLEGAGEIWAAEMAEHATPRQSVKTRAVSFLMANNLSPFIATRKRVKPEQRQKSIA